MSVKSQLAPLQVPALLIGITAAAVPFYDAVLDAPALGKTERMTAHEKCRTKADHAASQGDDFGVRYRHCMSNNMS